MNKCSSCGLLRQPGTEIVWKCPRCGDTGFPVRVDATYVRHSYCEATMEGNCRYEEALIGEKGCGRDREYRNHLIFMPRLRGAW